MYADSDNREVAYHRALTLVNYGNSGVRPEGLSDSDWLLVVDYAKDGESVRELSAEAFIRLIAASSVLQDHENQSDEALATEYEGIYAVLQEAPIALFVELMGSLSPAGRAVIGRDLSSITARNPDFLLDISEDRENFINNIVLGETKTSAVAITGISYARSGVRP